MIELSVTARLQIADLQQFYAERGRDAAIDRLADALERAGVRILQRRGLFFPAPRPYPHLVRAGWRWTKEGAYWIAFTEGAAGPMIQAVFHAAVDLPNRV